ncbi:MAG: hypothetical protein OQK55_03275 [Thermoanaerobaculales bacterium]|nr:hypothetical protein [Thermoanaerobaculales bacterium]
MGNTRITYRAVVGCLIAMMALGTGVAAAQEWGEASTRQRPGWWERESVQRELGLGSNQVSAIATIEEQNRELAREQRKAQQTAYRKMVRILASGVATEDEIAAARQALEDAWTGSIRQSVGHWIKLRDELSTEQWEKLPEVAPRVLQLGGFRTRAMGTFRIGEEGE